MSAPYSLMTYLMASFMVAWMASFWMAATASCPAGSASCTAGSASSDIVNFLYLSSLDRIPIILMWR